MTDNLKRNMAILKYTIAEKVHDRFKVDVEKMDKYKQSFREQLALKKKGVISLPARVFNKEYGFSFTDEWTGYLLDVIRDTNTKSDVGLGRFEDGKSEDIDAYLKDMSPGLGSVVRNFDFEQGLIGYYNANANKVEGIVTPSSGGTSAFAAGTEGEEGEGKKENEEEKEIMKQQEILLGKIKNAKKELEKGITKNEASTIESNPYIEFTKYKSRYEDAKKKRNITEQNDLLKRIVLAQKYIAKLQDTIEKKEQYNKEIADWIGKVHDEGNEYLNTILPIFKEGDTDFIFEEERTLPYSKKQLEEGTQYKEQKTQTRLDKFFNINQDRFNNNLSRYVNSSDIKKKQRESKINNIGIFSILNK